MYSKPWVSTLIFGVVGIIAGLTTLTLPETMGKRLPDTIEQAENPQSFNSQIADV